LSEAIFGTATIKDPTGLHARPAVRLARLAKKFISSIEVCVSKDGDWVDAKSTNSLMKMKARTGTDLHIRASGDDAETAVSELVKLISNDFEQP
jgi:phosphocarrier protein